MKRFLETSLPPASGSAAHPRESSRQERYTTRIFAWPGTSGREIRSQLLEERQDTAPPVHLTARQMEVLALLCEGMPNKLICRELKIATGTLKVHTAAILRVLGVANRLQAVVAAHHLGLCHLTWRRIPGSLSKHGQNNLNKTMPING